MFGLFFVHFFAENIVVFIEFLMTCFLIRRNSYKANKAVQVYRILSQYLHYFAPNNVITYLMTNAFVKISQPGAALPCCWLQILHLQHLYLLPSRRLQARSIHLLKGNSTLPNFLSAL
jgi:hypothetical protein